MSFKFECIAAAAKKHARSKSELKSTVTIRKERLVYDQGQILLRITETNGISSYQREEVVTDKRGVPTLRIIRSVKNGQLIEVYSGPVEWVMEPFHLERYKLIRRTYKKSK